VRRGTGRGGESILVDDGDDGDDDAGAAELFTAPVVDASDTDGRLKSILTDAVGEVRLGGDGADVGGGGGEV
jgi:hypothetical protein